jgi:BolA protein
MNIDEIKQRLNAYFTSDKVEVFDSRGTGDHFSVIVISEKFINVSLVDRHRMIYSIFEDKIVTDIHALQIQAYTLEEWKKKKISN